MWKVTCRRHARVLDQPQAPGHAVPKTIESIFNIEYSIESIFNREHIQYVQTDQIYEHTHSKSTAKRHLTQRTYSVRGG